MTDQHDGKLFGSFLVSGDGTLVNGELNLRRSLTNVYLSSNSKFDPFWRKSSYLHGALLDFTKVTLIDNIPLEGPIRGTRRGEEICAWRLFPHFVVMGDSHLEPDEKSIHRVTLLLEDATSLFYDFFAFGSMLDARPHIKELVHTNLEKSGNATEHVVIGDEPMISYFTGQREIARAETTLGTITAEHNPSQGWGGPTGVDLRNAVSISIVPNEKITFDEAMDRVPDLLRFYDLVLGTPQKIKEMWVSVRPSIAGQEESEHQLRVYWSFQPERAADFGSERRGPQPGDVLLDPIGHSAEYLNVLRNWLAMDEARKAARVRFSSGFDLCNRYTIERLVGAANMFDILPGSAIPKAIDLSSELMTAKKRCVEIFRTLDPSPERDSIRGALGRMGKVVLKHKVRHRARIIQSIVSTPFPDLDLVLDEAVNCRNYYVHGAEGRINYGSNGKHLSFLTDSLEFVFAASELIESGWDINRWRSNGTTMTHPFGRFVVEYRGRLQSLMDDLSSMQSDV